MPVAGHAEAAASVHNGFKPGTRHPAKEAQAQRAAQLREENEQVQQAMESHAVIDQAIGVLLAASDVTPGQGWDVLHEISHQTNRKLRHVAELLIEWAHTGNLPADIRTELDRQLARHAHPPQPDR
ncbi:ANTAR domain-containing protein [Streptomyces sp. NPDC127036]|uniref:ANTAR domain-containing protein n=1 Tax=Streptomyces sp. NPDC127036 TaxID=3347112 RepID=UPI00365025E4